MLRLSLVLCCLWVCTHASANRHCTVTKDTLCHIWPDTTAIPDVYFESTPEWDEAREQFASHWGTLEESDELVSPPFIVVPTTEDQIVSLLDFARRCDYAVAIRSGGHQLSGLSSCRDSTRKCLQINMSKFNGRVINYEEDQVTAKSVSFGVGNMLGDLYKWLVETKSGLFMVGGICPTVGLGGHYQSSGIGLFSNSFGLGVDNIVSFRIILADGTIKHVTANSDPGLFWAVRGGNPGSWGVITEYEVRALFDADYPHSFAIMYTYAFDKEVMRQLLKVKFRVGHAIIENDVADLSLYMTVSQRLAVSAINVILIWSGKDLGDIFSSGAYDTYAQPFLDVAEPTLNKQEFAAPISTITANLVFPDLFVVGDRYYQESRGTMLELGDDYVDAVIDIIDEGTKIDGVGWMMQFASNSGEIRVDDASSGAFPYRQIVNVLDHWIVFTEENAEVAKDLLHRYFEATPELDTEFSKFLYSTGFGDKMKLDWQFYYDKPQAYARLQRVKNRVDPCNVFRNDMTIPVTKRHGRKKCRRSRRKQLARDKLC